MLNIIKQENGCFWAIHMGQSERYWRTLCFILLRWTWCSYYSLLHENALVDPSAGVCHAFKLFFVALICDPISCFAFKLTFVMDSNSVWLLWLIVLHHLIQPTSIAFGSLLLTSHYLFLLLKTPACRAIYLMRIIFFFRSKYYCPLKPL